MEHTYIQTNGIKLHVVKAGDENGKLVILLHGFPEFWYEWRHQIEYLASQGYFVLAPDQRGYNLSDKPEGVENYNRDLLAQDVIGLIKAAGRDKCYLVGHDWGAAVSWWMANKHPQYIEKMIIINVPHHKIMGKELRTTLDQKRRSWYIFFFQTPELPEWALRRQNFAVLAGTLKASFNSAYTKEERDEYRKAWAQPGALTGMVNWYRAAARLRLPRPASPRITVPVLMIWGKHDHALRWQMAQPSIELCDNGRLIMFEDATHWIVNEKPDEINHLIDGFFRE